MPRVWANTIDAHRAQVIEAVLDSAAALVDQVGLTEVSMSALAERSGIGRATLYRYFPTLDAVLLEWHQREVSRHLAELEAACTDGDDAFDQLRAVLTAYARRLAHGHHGDMATALHRTAHVKAGHARLEAFITDLVAQAAAEGAVRHDATPAELAVYALHALNAAAALRSAAATRRLLDITIDGLQGTSGPVP